MEIVVWAYARERCIAELARLPEELALGGVLRRSYVRGAVLSQDSLDAGGPIHGLLAKPFDLDEEKRSRVGRQVHLECGVQCADGHPVEHLHRGRDHAARDDRARRAGAVLDVREDRDERDRKSTRLNSSHSQISYAVFCLKKKKSKSR